MAVFLVGLSAVSAVKLLLILEFCFMTVMMANVFYHNDGTTCFDLGISWAAAILVDFTITNVMIQAWIFYKEANWILRVILMVIINFFGSWGLSVFILVEISKLSPEEISKSLFYYLLAQRHKRDVAGPSVAIAKAILLAAIGIMGGVLIYTIIVFGSPFHIELYTGPCILSEVVDHIVTLFFIYAWIRYKESSLISSFLWMLSITCFSSIALCAYMWRELSYLSPKEPVSFVLFNRSDRDLMSNDPLLSGDANA